MNFVDKSLYNNLAFYSKASEIWADLRQTYYKLDDTRMFSLLQEISRTTQGTDSVSVYYIKLKLLWDEYSALKSTTKCSYVAIVDIATEE